MASNAKRPDGGWRARYRDAAGKEHAKHFARKIDAQRWLDEVTAAVVTGQYVDPRAGRVTLRDYATAWASGQVGRDNTARITDNALRVHIFPRLGDRPMHAVRHSDVQALVKACSETLAPGTVRNVYDVLARVFSSAVDDRVVAATPCRRIILPRLEDVEIVPPSVEQVLTLVEVVEPRYRGAVVLLAGSGLRVGELLGARIGDVDFLRRSIRVERQRLQDNTIAPTKTGKSVRTVPLGQVVVDELAAHLAAYPSSEWLFTTRQGRPLVYRQWQNVWRRAKTAATIEDLSTHDLRHFFASALIAGGASVKQVQAVLGHANAMITLRTYAHLWPGDDDRTRDVMDATLSVLRTGCGPDTSAATIAAGQGASDAP
jgi:integrase